MSVTPVNEETFRYEVLESDLPVVVDFHADWCMPCRQVAPAIEVLARAWDGQIRFVKLDIDENPGVARAYAIVSIPAVLLFERGEVSAWSIGAKPTFVIERELGLQDRGSTQENESRAEEQSRTGRLHRAPDSWQGCAPGGTVSERRQGWPLRSLRHCSHFRRSGFR